MMQRFFWILVPLLGAGANAAAGSFSAAIDGPEIQHSYNSVALITYFSGRLHVDQVKIGTGAAILYAHESPSGRDTKYDVVEVEFPEATYLILSQTSVSGQPSEALVIDKQTGNLVLRGELFWEWNVEGFRFTFIWPD